MRATGQANGSTQARRFLAAAPPPRCRAPLRLLPAALPAWREAAPPPEATSSLSSPSLSLPASPSLSLPASPPSSLSPSLSVSSTSSTSTPGHCTKPAGSAAAAACWAGSEMMQQRWALRCSRGSAAQRQPIPASGSRRALPAPAAVPAHLLALAAQAGIQGGPQRLLLRQGWVSRAAWSASWLRTAGGRLKQPPARQPPPSLERSRRARSR